VVTVEIEHIDVGALQELVDMGIDVQPTPHTLKTIQARGSLRTSTRLTLNLLLLLRAPV
jgi:phosphoribosylaminoimidazole carboxylase (NCAIR synthetase)